MRDKPQLSIAGLQRTLRAGCASLAGLGNTSTGDNSVNNLSRLGIWDSPAAPVNGAATTAATRRNDERPTHDQLYLVGWFAPSSAEVDAAQPRLTPAAIQKLNCRYGVRTVTDALRLFHGFPPEIAVRSPYAYVEGICKGRS